MERTWINKCLVQALDRYGLTMEDLTKQEYEELVANIADRTKTGEALYEVVEDEVYNLFSPPLP